MKKPKKTDIKEVLKKEISLFYGNGNLYNAKSDGRIYNVRTGEIIYEKTKSGTYTPKKEKNTTEVKIKR